MSKSGHDRAPAELVPPLLRAALQSPSKSLEPEERSLLEPKFGHDFANVRVHTGSSAIALTRTLSARALTFGPAIFFNEGERTPGAQPQLLAHELSHVVQQRNASPSVGTSVAIGARGDIWEREADAAACAMFRADASGPGSLSEASSPSLQGSFYSEAKEASYDAVIDGLRQGKRLILAPLRARLATLPNHQRSPLEAQIDEVEAILDVLVSLAVTLLGIGVGFGEGLFSLVQGIWSLLEGIGKYLVTLLWGFVDGGRLFDEHHAAVLAAFKQMGPGLVALVKDFQKRWAAASPERQSIMIGELTGQVLAFIATLGGAAAKASTLPRLTLLEPSAFMQTAGGTMAMSGTGASVSAQTLGAFGGAVLMSQVYGSKTNQAAADANAAAKAAVRRHKMLAQFPRVKGIYVLINKRIRTGYVGMSAGRDGIWGRLGDIKHAKALQLLEAEGTYGYWMEVGSVEGLIGEDLVRVIKLVEQDVLETRAAQFKGKVLFTNSGRAELSLQKVADWLAEGVYDAEILSEGVVKAVHAP